MQHAESLLKPPQLPLRRTLQVQQPGAQRRGQHGMPKSPAPARLPGSGQGQLPRALPQALQSPRERVLASVQCEHCHIPATVSSSSWLGPLLDATA